jgi:hypothetical protein
MTADGHLQTRTLSPRAVLRTSSLSSSLSTKAVCARRNMQANQAAAALSATPVLAHGDVRNDKGVRTADGSSHVCDPLSRPAPPQGTTLSNNLATEFSARSVRKCSHGGKEWGRHFSDVLHEAAAAGLAPGRNRTCNFMSYEGTAMRCG